ncbi:hypothetical protein COO60DRAFT_1643634 [Scenedesmus sp. NREL 46B-D3]|nr:hypothetical protein COO60DRAFT_1643634 [Scenedesmus sp. NREL 46B-D3]
MHCTAGLSSNWGQQYAVSSSTGAAGTGSGSAVAGASPSSARGQAGYWGRTYGRPTSNPAPSRPAAGHLASPTGVGPGRCVTPGRGPPASATAACPKVRSSHPTSTQQQQHHRQADDASATPDGGGGLQCPPSPDPMAPAKLGYAFSLLRSNVSKQAHQQAAAAGLSSSLDSGMQPARGPRELAPHSPINSAGSTSSTSSASSSSSSSGGSSSSSSTLISLS